MDIFKVAEENFDRHIRQNPYPGRGLVIGRSTIDSGWLMIYWIMGRSQHSQNRRFVIQGKTVRTEPVDQDLVDDPSLIIYEAMLELPGIYLVSNGDQTRTLYEALRTDGTFDAALATREREPDAPNYTPRISGMLETQNQQFPLMLSILKANPADPDLTDRITYRPAPPPAGLGLGLTTYAGDGDPLPSFEGDPILLPCSGTPEELLDSYWDGLNAQNRISLAIKRIQLPYGDTEIIIRNRFGD